MAAMADQREENGVTLSPEQKKRQRARNIAIGLVVGFLCALFYALTIVKLGPGVLTPRP